MTSSIILQPSVVAIALTSAVASGCCLLSLLFIRYRHRRHRLIPLSSTLLDSLFGAGVVVTGSGSGIGAQLVNQLMESKRPALVVATRRPPSNCTHVGMATDENIGEEVLQLMQVDFADVASIRRFADNLVELFRSRGVRLSRLVCNAGVFFPVEKLSTDNLMSHQAVNFIANVELVRLLLRNGLLEPGYTRVLFVSSSLSRRGVARDATGGVVYLGSAVKDSDVVAKVSSTVAKGPSTVSNASDAVAKVSDPVARVSTVVAKATTPTSASQLYADSKQCLNLLAQHLHVNLGVHSCAAFTGGPVATRLLVPTWLPKFLQPPLLWLLSLILKSPEQAAADFLELMCRPDLTSGRVYSCGKPVDWPLELSPNCLADFVRDYEQMLDTLPVDEL